MRIRKLILLHFLFSISSAIDTITPAHPISNGEILISANGMFALGFFTPPNTTNTYLGIWYNNLTIHTVVWVANRRNPIPNLKAQLSISTENASLHLITSGNSTPLWSSPSFSNSTLINPSAQLLDTGNFVLKSQNSNSILWQSFDHPTDTLLPGMKLGPNLQTGIDRNLTSWLSPSDPSPGKYTFMMDLESIPQVVIRAVSDRLIWRGEQWNGYYSSSGPSQFLNESLGNVFIGFQSSPEDIYLHFNSISDTIYKLTMDQDEKIRMYRWRASLKKWDVVWSAPEDACDFFPGCGTNAICDSHRSPMCQCVDGFEPMMQRVRRLMRSQLSQGSCGDHDHINKCQAHIEEF